VQVSRSERDGRKARQLVMPQLIVVNGARNDFLGTRSCLGTCWVPSTTNRRSLTQSIELLRALGPQLTPTSELS